MLKYGLEENLLYKKIPLIPASMIERFISVCIKNPVRAYLAAILKIDAAKSFCK